MFHHLLLEMVRAIPELKFSAASVNRYKILYPKRLKEIETLCDLMTKINNFDHFLLHVLY